MLCMHGEVEEEVWSECSASSGWWDRSLVPGDVNPHSSGLGAREVFSLSGSSIPEESVSSISF